VLLACSAPEAGQPQPQPQLQPSAEASADPKLRAALHTFVNVDLRTVDGAGFDAVCRELLRRYLFAHTELVVREVARAGVEVEANLALCLDYAITDARRTKLLTGLYAIENLNARERRVRDTSVSRVRDSEPDWP
jgi:hypothetical protein